MRWVTRQARARTGIADPHRSSCEGSRNGSGLRITARTTLNMTVFAPIPKAGVNNATMANPGPSRSARSA